MGHPTLSILRSALITFAVLSSAAAAPADHQDLKMRRGPRLLELAMAGDVESQPAAGTTPTLWVQQQNLMAPDGGPLDAFGNSVSIDGDTALVVAYGKGVGYVYARTGTVWSLQQELTAPDGGTRFSSVSVNGETALSAAARRMSSILVWLRSMCLRAAGQSGVANRC